jgi:hypothetical protein
MKRFTRSTAGLAATAAAAVALIGMSGTALAASPTPVASTAPAHQGQDLAAIQKKAAADITRRLASLSVAINDVNNSTAISSADKTTLLATLNGDVTGLTALGATIAGDTTAQQALTDSKTIYTGFRVYALALPQVRFAAAADTITVTVLPKLTDAQSKLAALLAGVDAGKNTPAVQAKMTDLANQISAITGATTGLSSTVLAYTPAQYDANHALLSPARASLATSRDDIRTARGDIAFVAAALK